MRLIDLLYIIAMCTWVVVDVIRVRYINELKTVIGGLQLLQKNNASTITDLINVNERTLALARKVNAENKRLSTRIAELQREADKNGTV